MHGTFAAGEEFLDHHRFARVAKNLVDHGFAQGVFRRGKIFRDGHALAEG